MKFTLAVVLIVFASGGADAARGQPSSQPPAPQAEAPQPSGAEASPQQAPNAPPTTSQPCAPGKDPCTEPPAQQEPASAPATKAQPRKAAAKVTGSRKTKARRHTAAKDQPAANVATAKKTIVQKGSTSDPTALLTPGATTETSYSRQTTTDLLAATDANLKQAAARSLNKDQVETVSQIKLFMEQANTAIKAGELDRGHNLAVKAHLLSDDLVKH